MLFTFIGYFLMIKALSVKHIRYNVLKLIDILLNKKDMDLDKLRNMVRLVAASQTDKYKRFSIANYTDLYYKTNDLMAWAREKQAQNQSSSNVARV